jgi:hypothetical protein
MKTLSVRKVGPVRLGSLAYGCYNSPLCQDCPTY